MSYLTRSVRRLLGLDATWRLVDAYTPRIFGLFLNTFLIAKFGAALYALPGWLLGMYGLFLAVLPDPHSYILVRASGHRASSLYKLTVPFLVSKSVFCALLVFIVMFLTTSVNIIEIHGADWSKVAGAVLFYGGTEFLWAVLGTTSLAIGNVKISAQYGVIARIISAVFLLLLWRFGDIDIAASFFIAAFPVCVAWCFLSPYYFRWRRVMLFAVYSVKKYAGWMQGISLITAALFQLPIIALGAWPKVDPSLVGVAAFTNRLLMAGFQPFQILQSVVIRNAAKGNLHMDSSKFFGLKSIFKMGGAILGMLSFVAIAYAWRLGVLTSDGCGLIVAVCFGVSVSIWYRYELAVSLAVNDIKNIFFRGYVPSFCLAVAGIPVLMSFYSVAGLSLAVVVGWVALSNSWRWSK